MQVLALTPAYAKPVALANSQQLKAFGSPTSGCRERWWDRETEVSPGFDPAMAQSVPSGPTAAEGIRGACRAWAVCLRAWAACGPECRDYFMAVVAVAVVLSEKTVAKSGGLAATGLARCPPNRPKGPHRLFRINL